MHRWHQKDSPAKYSFKHKIERFYGGLDLYTVSCHEDIRKFLNWIKCIPNENLELQMK